MNTKRQTRKNTKQEMQSQINILRNEIMKEKTIIEPSVAEVLKKYENALTQLYDFIANLRMPNVQSDNNLNKEKFLRFCVLFKLVPQLATQTQMIKMFNNSIGNKQEGQSAILINYATYEDLEQLLLEIAVFSGIIFKRELQNVSNEEKLLMLFQYLKFDEENFNEILTSINAENEAFCQEQEDINEINKGSKVNTIKENSNSDYYEA